MKRFLLLLFSCFTFSVAYSQQVVWERTVGYLSSPDTVALEYTLLPDGGFAAVFRENYVSARLTRYDSLGNTVWNHRFAQGMRLNDGYHTVVKVVPGGLLVGLQKFEPDTSRLAVVKLNWQGTELWTKIIPTGRNFNSSCDLYIKSPNEYVLLAAGSNMGQLPSDGASPKFMAFGLDSLGNKLWQQTYLDPLVTNDFPKDIVPYRENGYLLAGGTGTNGFFPRMFKTDSIGNLLQSAFIQIDPPSTTYHTYHSNFMKIADGDIVFSGFNNVSNYPDRYLMVSKMDTSLNVHWTVALHDTAAGHSETSQVIEMADSTILVVTQKHLNNRIVLFKISPQGQVLDTSYITTTHQTGAIGVMNAYLLPDSSLFYGGYLFMAKIASVGLPMLPPPAPIDTTDTLVVAQKPMVSAKAGLGNAFPNPTQSKVTIPYNLPKGTTTATLQIAEVATGRLVSRVTLDLKAEKAELQLSHLKAGLYTTTLLMDGVPVGTKKLVVIK